MMPAASPRCRLRLLGAMMAKTRTARNPRQCKESRAVALRRGRMREVSPTGVEPVTFGSGGRRSIQLSYGDGRWALRPPLGLYRVQQRKQVTDRPLLYWTSVP